MAQLVLVWLVGCFRLFGAGASVADSDCTWAASAEGLNTTEDSALLQLQRTTATTTGSCVLSSTERCPISLMPPGQSTLVYTGGPTKCLGNKPYAFQVIPGSPRHLAIIFAGGGICATPQDVQSGACTVNPEPTQVGPGNGMFDFRNHKNPFRLYSFVLALYCSGDGHLGENTLGTGGMGFVNAMAVLDWARENGNFDAELDSLVVGGSSAGALGVQIWASYVLKVFKAERAAVVMDGFVNVLPQAVIAQYAANLGLCQQDLQKLFGPSEGSALQNKCATGQIDVEDFLKAAMRSFPKAAFTTVQPKTDSTQIWNSNRILAIFGLPVAFDQESFYFRVNQEFLKYSNVSNFASFVVQGSLHSLLLLSEFYDIRTTGLHGHGHLLYEWLRTLPVRFIGRCGSKRHVLQSECAGQLLAPPAALTCNCTDYCDPVVTSKVATGW